MGDSLHVLHLVGNVTAPVRRIMEPAVAALKRVKARQTIVTMGRCNEILNTDGLAYGVGIVSIDPETPLWLRLIEFRRQVERLLRSSTPSQVHVHGMLPWIATYGLGGKRLRTIFFTPHGSGILRWLRPAVHLGMSIESLLIQNVRFVALPSRPLDARRLNWLEARPTVWGSVEDTLLTLRRELAPAPFLVASSTHGRTRDIEAFCKIAVVLGTSTTGMSFGWSGPATDEARQHLEAAGIRIEAGNAPSLLLKQAWMHVSFDTDSGGSPRLIEALALGVPCIVPSSTLPEKLIDDGVNGLTFRSGEHCLELLTRLLDDDEQRERIGRNGRNDAWRLFNDDAVQRSLMRSYDVESGDALGPRPDVEWQGSALQGSQDPWS